MYALGWMFGGFFIVLAVVWMINRVRVAQTLKESLGALPWAWTRSASHIGTPVGVAILAVGAFIGGVWILVDLHL